MAKIFVTGGAGYIGSVLVPELLTLGHAVTVLDNFMFKQSSLNSCCANANFKIVNGDVRNYNLVKDLIADAGDGAGDDQADSGTKTFEREHEMSLVINAKDMVLQTERALARIDDKTYGNCEVCSSPIGKARLQVFPRATLCMICKQKEERR
jgi:RNA polymerase-binding transcription factor DksA